MSNVTTSDIITQQAIHDVVQDALREDLSFREAYRDLSIAGLSNDTIELPVEQDNMAYPERVGENAEFPRDKEDIETVPVTVEKYGLEVTVSRESQQDSVFDVVARQVEAKARKMQEKLNELAFEELDANLHPNSPVDAGGTAGELEWDDVIEARTVMHQDKQDPDLLVVNVQGEADLLRTEEYQRATDDFDQTIREAAVGRVAGFDVVLDNSDHMSQDNGEAYMINTDRYGYEVVKEDVSTDEYVDQSRHADIFQIWTRRAYKALEPEAAIKIEP